MSIVGRVPLAESPDEQTSEIKRIVVSSILGTAVEWYDFLIYGTASALVFNKLLLWTKANLGLSPALECVQRSITVREAKDAQAASEKAKRAFERLENVADWKYHAQFFEIDMTDQRSLRPRAVLGQRTKDHS